VDFLTTRKEGWGSRLRYLIMEFEREETFRPEVVKPSDQVCREQLKESKRPEKKLGRPKWGGPFDILKVRDLLSQEQPVAFIL